jgi:three-Cys-motif partner protein
MSSEQCFGGDWTREKLMRVEKYLNAYVKIMSRNNFRFAYIDAFAGTGYRTMAQESMKEGSLFPGFFDDESYRFLDGSARIALRIRPAFEKYIFVERDARRFLELKKIADEFTELRERIILKNEEANHVLSDLCGKNWKNHRAVLFLDPYGMQVPWKTIEVVAQTRAIDMWYLFPLGVAVNRLLKKDGQLDAITHQRLNELFGKDDWYPVFYNDIKEYELFGAREVRQKVADFALIGEYLVNRLKTIFPGVAENPLALYNSKNNPLYLLCFAAGNEKGAPVAKKIAQDILGR